MIESIEVPEISPATRKDFLPISSRSDRTVINPYVIRAKNIQEDNFIDFQNFDYSAYRKLLAFLSRYRSYVLEPTAGSGSFAINCARNKKTVGFLLIEKRFKRAIRALEKSKILGLRNIFCLRGKFEDFAPFLPKDFFQVVYLAFPDPWMKEKWSQNRIYEEV
ncbi:MAG: tRNA (guanine-N(7)-)-methyltransferase, partial [Deltaproteobacteria bacterium]|nr:tRNA (guanine-N(7)-)-methyltransferase [Deltaproteobacteria bacterium]